MAKSTASTGHTNGFEQAGTRVANHPLARQLARLGFVCKAIVYAVLSTLALLAAFGLGGEATDSRGAIRTLAQEHNGRALVAVLAIGMVGLGAWFIIEAVADRDEQGNGWQQIIVRLAKAIGGLGYIGLAWWAGGVALGQGSGPSSDSVAQSLTARTLALPAGRLLVAAAGVTALIIAFHQARNGWRAPRRGDIAYERMSDLLRAVAPRLALVGYSAQGLVFALIGIFFLQAAVQGDPKEATSFDGALDTVARQPFGMALLAVVAVGLLAYAATAAVEGRFKRL